MIIDWPLILFLFCLSLPGVLIAMKRLVYLLLPNNTEALKKRISRFAIIQTALMVLVMCFTGAVLSQKTGLNAPLLEALLQGKASLGLFILMLIPTLLYSLIGLIVFCSLYYGLISSILDEQSLLALRRLRTALKLDGCLLYGGVVEELIARWGLMNLIAFFSLLFAKQMSNSLMIWALVISGLLFAVGQIPAYIAAGCVASRRFLYSLVLLSLCQSLLFGFLFWQYGLLAAILGHMFFHLGWNYYDKIDAPAV